MSIYSIQRREFHGISRGQRATFGEGVSAAFAAGRLRAGFFPDERRQDEIYEPLNQWLPSIINARGQLGFRPEGAPAPLPDDLMVDLMDGNFRPDDDTLGRLLAELADQGHEIPEEVSVEAIQARREEVNARYSAAFDRERDTLGRMGQVGGFFAGLVGGIGAEFTDPANVALSLAGAPARVGFLGLVGIEAAINAGIEVAQTPGRNVLLRELDQDEEGYLQNALFGAAFGGVFAGALRGAQIGFPAAYRRVAPLFNRREGRRALLDATRDSTDPVVQVARDQVQRDVDDEAAAVTNPHDDGARLEHVEREAETAAALAEGRAPDMPDRPLAAVPRASIIGGMIEEVDPRDLLVQPDVFQFRSNVVAEGGQTQRLLDVTEWHPERAGIVIVYEYADGSRAIADGHQRTGLARRVMAQTGEEIRMAARVFRETDGFSPEDIRVLAALKNIAEASDGMSVAMARDAARVLRVRPEAIAQLPAGPGIARAQALSRLSDDAFDMFINEVVPQRFAELVGRMVENPQMHAAMMNLLRRTGPETTTQAESILAQALQAPVRREITADLFGEQEVVQSLYLERAKVLERAMRLMRDDRSVFRTLDERAERIEGTGANRLDTATNRETRQQVERALAAVQKLAHRAGPISEALNDGATAYRDTGRLKDAAQRVADAVRGEVQRNGLAGAGDGPGRRAAKPESARTDAPDPNEGFSDPVSGPGAREQIEATRLDANERPASASGEPRAGPDGRGDRAEGQGQAGQDLSQVNQLLEDARGRLRDRAAEADRLAADDRSIRMQTEDGRGALVSPAADRPGAWRVTTFGDDGKPSGHIDAPTKRDAVVRALEDGYQARAPQTERTSAGEQGLFDGINPITQRDRLDQRMAQPLGRGEGAARDSQIGGLFDPDDAVRSDLFDQVPVGRGLDADGNEIAVVRSRAEIAAELDADDAAVSVLDACVRR